jgi:hypothetical protein
MVGQTPAALACLASSPGSRLLFPKRFPKAFESDLDADGSPVAKKIGEPFSVARSFGVDGKGKFDDTTGDNWKTTDMEPRGRLSVWLAIEPLDMRSGTEAALARVTFSTSPQ